MMARRARPVHGGTADLDRDAFGVMAHDLGSLATALELRADVLAAAIPAADHQALIALAGEVRSLNRTLRLLRGPQGSDLLAPVRLTPLASWWHLVSRLTAAVLPRGTRVEAQLGADELDAPRAHGLTYIWLAACRDLARREGAATTAVVTLTSQHDPVRGVSTVRADFAPAGEGAAAAVRDSARWERYARRRAEPLGATLRWWDRDDRGTTWSCTIASSSPR